ncbi:TPA: hypothetical protein ACJJ1A_000600 [Enterobacter hormaechei subsp. xiangfangensis]|uniref:hypothetical protein n=1 Tax=Enterobacter hormaechei TaxID=158836 RepID=UPI000797A813|nr:hypothetical protein [Enterobacter hormaechei]SAH21991.1 Uncharacterised protein [Enterobacter hormaechei]
MSEDQKSVVNLKPGFVYQPIGGQKPDMGTVEPIISASKMSDEDLYSWMEEKLSAVRRLRELQLIKSELEERLAGIESQIEEATTQSRIDVWREDLVLNAALIEGGEITKISL